MPCERCYLRARQPAQFSSLATLAIVFGGIGLLQGLIAAFGAALFVGNAAALLRSRDVGTRPESWSDRQNRRRRSGPGAPSQVRKVQSSVMAALGLLICVWAIASMLKK